MSEMEVDCRTLDRECGVFCRYLISQEPSEYVKRKYEEAHRHRSLAHADRSNPADHLLVKIARTSPCFTKVIDAYASVFHPSSLVRKKLVLLLAILESCAPTHAYMDSVDSNSVLLFLVVSLQRCFTFALLMVVATLIILPLELTVRGSTKLVVLWLPRHG